MASTVITDWFLLDWPLIPACQLDQKKVINFPIFSLPFSFSPCIIQKDTFSLHLYPKHTNVYKTVTRISSKSKWFVRSPEIRLRQGWLYYCNVCCIFASFSLKIKSVAYTLLYMYKDNIYLALLRISDGKLTFLSAALPPTTLSTTWKIQEWFVVLV